MLDYPIMNTPAANHRPAPTRTRSTRVPPPRAARKPSRNAMLPLAAIQPPRGIERGRWKSIVIHHSGTPNDTPQTMDRYHRENRGWSNGLGYHFVIGNGVNYADGKIYVGRRWRQQIAGAHCKSKAGRFYGVWRASNFFNTNGIGICLIGNFEHQSPTPRQLAALETLVEHLRSLTRVPISAIHGHGDVTHKTACPGKRLTSRLGQMRRALAKLPALDHDSRQTPTPRLGLHDHLATVANQQRQSALFSANRLSERGNVSDRFTLNLLDHIADLDPRATGRAVP